MQQGYRSLDNSVPIKYFIALSLVHAPLWLKARLLTLTDFDPLRLWGEWKDELLQYSFFRKRLLGFKDWDEVERIQDFSYENNIVIVAAGSAFYPKSLNNIFDLPVLLFCKGELSLLNSTSLAVVGTRAVSPYGVAVLSRFIPILVEAGFCIVSGMAIGVDASAHKATLKAKGNTIAVLGSGVEKPSPVQNSHLYKEIIDNGGLVVSEFAPNARVLKQNFPQRNRIIAGLCKGTLIIEAGAKSGSLITADIAQSYSRDVFSVPGPITSSLSEGVNSLINNGAVMVCSPEDILAHYDLLIRYQRSKKIKELSLEQKIFLSMIPPQGASLNELLCESGKAMTQVLKNIDELEHAGYINRDELGIYYLN